MARYVLTDEETHAIRALERLAKRWPRSLMLASMGGSLFVIPTDDHSLTEPDGGIDPDSVVASLGGRIPNTGGDW